jgi:hypothetical protein
MSLPPTAKERVSLYQKASMIRPSDIILAVAAAIDAIDLLALLSNPEIVAELQKTKKLLEGFSARASVLIDKPLTLANSLDLFSIQNSVVEIKNFIDEMLQKKVSKR